MSNTGTPTHLIPTTTPPIINKVGAKADSTNAEVETDEMGNDHCSTTTVTVPKPDLVVSALSMTATTIKAGGSVLVTKIM